MELKAYAPPVDAIIDLLLDAVCVVDADGRFLFVSAAGERIFGYTPAEMLGKPMIDFVVLEDRESTLQAARRVQSGHLQLDFENRYLRKDGRPVHVMWSARRSEADGVRVAVARDVTERKRAEAMQAALYAISEAAYTAEDLPALFRQIHQIVARLVPTAVFSVALCEEGGQRLSFPYHASEQDPRTDASTSDAQALCANVVRTGEPLLLGPCPTAAGIGHAPSWLVVPLKAQQDTTAAIGAMALKSRADAAPYTARDQELLQFISTQAATAIERKRLHARLQYLAQVDPLTGLPNRGVLLDRLDVALRRARRGSERMGVLYLDLDDFKRVNDTLGHAAGDALLQQVAVRLRQALRDVDTVARIGGDEFVVLLEDVGSAASAALVADKIREAIAAPLRVGEHCLRIRPSIGIAAFPEHGGDAAALLKHADAAMYAAKKEDGSRLKILPAAAPMDPAARVRACVPGTLRPEPG